MQQLIAVAGYKPLLAARVVSAMMVWLDITVIYLLLGYHWTADAMAVGTAAALYGLPGLVFGPCFGSLADRSNPLTMLLASYAARGISSVLLILAPDLHVFVLLVMVKGLANTSAMPPEQVLLRSILSDAQIVANAGVMTAADQATKIGAPLIAAGMATLYGPGAGLWLSAGLALLAIGCLVPIHAAAHRAVSQKAAVASTRQLAPLLALLRSSHAVRVSLGCLITMSAMFGLYDPLLALFLAAQGLPASTFGSLVSVTAAGAVCGALAFRRLHRWRGYRLALLGLPGFGLTVLVPGVLAGCGLPVPSVLWLGLWLLNGGAYSLAVMSVGVEMQQQCPRHCLGSVSATARSLQLAALVAAPLLGGILAHRIGIAHVFVLSGSLAIAGGWFWTWQMRRAEAAQQSAQDGVVEQRGP
jgi:predicted MFS family arabinose efflux permease